LAKLRERSNKGTLILRNVAILAGADFELLQGGFIEIREGRISDLGDGPTGSASHASDCEGLIAIPGFVDAHTHVGDSVAKEAGIGLPIADVVSPSGGLKHKILASTPDSELIVAMRESLIDMIRSGITTFADFRESGAQGIELLHIAAQGLPIRPVVLGRLAQVPFSRDELSGNIARLPTGAIEELTDLLSTSDGVAPSTANDLTDPGLEQIRDLVDGKRKLRAIHVAETEESIEKSRSRTGHSDVERVMRHFNPDFVVHMTNATDADIELVAKSQVSVVCCPRANAILGVGVPPLTRMIQRGMNVGLGTDNVMLNQPDMFREMDYTARMIRAVERDPREPSCREVLKMATLNGAKALKLDKEIGSIEVGKLADIVLVSGHDSNLRHTKDIVSSLVLRAGVHNVEKVLAAGRIVYERGQ
jgi:cytosine/adenosine deaminase-related metal-dependent hydrolase